MWNFSFTEEYKQVEELQKADAVLVRSAAMHDMQDVPNLLAVARAGAGVNNIPIADYSEKGIVVFNTPGANANGVKEMVIAGMLLASRDLIGGNKWVEENKEDPNITKAMEKAKSICRKRNPEQKDWCYWSWSNQCSHGQCCTQPQHGSLRI